MPSPRRFIPRLESLERREVLDAAPFVASPADYLGTVIRRGQADSAGQVWGYDHQPSIMYDATLPAAQRFQMWWFGEYKGQAIDGLDVRPQDNSTLSPAASLIGDRIFYAASADGTNWSKPQVVLKGALGTGGGISADDHELGSPSVLKIGGTYYMFYEAYATHATVVNRFLVNGDYWVTNGYPQIDQVLPAGTPDYPLGFAPKFRKAGTHAVFSGEVNSAGKINRFLSLAPVSNSVGIGGSFRPLNVAPDASGQPLSHPVFWLYDNAGPVLGEREALYARFDLTTSDTFYVRANEEDPNLLARILNHAVVAADVDPNTPGIQDVLGYVATRLDGPDMTGNNQNRVMMATSADGKNWTRFQGPARGGAVVAPQDELTSARGYDLAAARQGDRPNASTDPQNVEYWDIHRVYGSGYPSALVRDGSLELYFSDDTVAGQADWWRVRLPVEQITNPASWAVASVPANRQPAQAGSDIKWSPLHQRYLAVTTRTTTGGPVSSPSFQQSLALVWSGFRPSSSGPLEMPLEQSLPGLFNTNVDVNGNETTLGRFALHSGGILGDGLGNTVDFFDPNPYTALHLFYAAAPTGVWDGTSDNKFLSDLDHTLLFLAPNSGAITGRVYHDANGNGRADAGEGGLVNWAVYHDANGNGQRDGGEAHVITDAAGGYRLQRLAGSYVLRVERSTGWTLTAGGNGLTVAIGGGAVTAGHDFGASPPGAATGRVFHDANGNGRADAGEGGLVNWAVYHDANGNGQRDGGEAHAITDAAGGYWLVRPAGSYVLRVERSAGWTLTAGGNGLSVTIGINAVTAGHDFGASPPAPPLPLPGAATGRVFHDANGNGRADAGEGGLGGRVVYHDTNGNGRRDAGEVSTTTDAAGTYRLQLYAGFYVLRTEPTTGWSLTAGANGLGVGVTNGSTSMGLNFGAFLPSMIQGTVFDDRNRNGRQDSGDAALAGWVVYIDANNNGRLDAGETQTAADLLGRYQFVVTPGSHRVRVVARDDYVTASGRTVTVAAGKTAPQNFGMVRR